LGSFLENLGMDLFKLWHYILPDRKHPLGLKVAYGSVFVLPSVLSQSKCFVIDTSAQINMPI
jgi:hypothetical protein